MGFLDGLKFSGHDSKQFYYGENVGRSQPMSMGGKRPAYKDNWDVDRAVTEGNDRVTWVFKSVYAIAANAARLPMEINNLEGDSVDHPLLPILNRMANPHHDAYNFRFQLSSQVMLSKRGAFVEVLRDRLDNVIGLYMLPPNFTYPIPDPKKFVSGYSVQVPNQEERVVAPENVVWIRIPHPTDPYRGQSPLEACGLAIDIDYYSRIYNRNFMINDGRPGGILMVNGEIDDDAADLIRRRFLGSTGSALGGAGRLTILEAEAAQYIDTSATQRDAQYTETKQLAKEEILMAFGVPESVIGNAAMRTFANADTELEVFWRETMLPHLMLIERGLDRLDGSEDLIIKHNVEDVAILSRDERERAAFHLEELKFGAISVDEYRQKTNRDPVGADLLYIQANLMPIGVTEIEGQTPSEFEPPTMEDGPQPDAPENIGPEPDNRASPNREPVAMPPSTTASLDGITEEKSEGKESDPLDKWGFKFGDLYIDSVKATEISQRRARNMDTMINSVSLQMVNYFQRQRRVILEKWNSKKIRDKINKGSLVSVNDIYDVAVWDRQLLADSKSWLTAAIVDGGNEFALMLQKELEPDEDLVAAGVIAGLSRMASVNQTTRSLIEAIIVEGVSKGKSVDAIAEDIREVFSKAVSQRARVIASNMIVFGVNEGQMIEASKSGFQYKVWLTRQDDKVRQSHTNADGQARPLYDPFSVSGHAMMHPGALTAPIEETVNCRCTMLFTNEPNPAAMLEFGVTDEVLSDLRDASVIATLIRRSQSV